MAWTTKIMVVANATATSPELTGALLHRAERGQVEFSLVMPASAVTTPGAQAHRQLDTALEHLRGAGLNVVEGRIGSIDPICAISDEWDPRRYDEIIVSTLPQRVSKWLHEGLPDRAQRLTGASVTHVVAQPAKAQLEARPVPPHDSLGPIAPLSVLAWGARRDK